MVIVHGDLLPSCQYVYALMDQSSPAQGQLNPEKCCLHVYTLEVVPRSSWRGCYPIQTEALVGVKAYKGWFKGKGRKPLKDVLRVIIEGQGYLENHMKGVEGGEWGGRGGRREGSRGGRRGYLLV